MWVTLLGNNREHPEWDQFYDSLDVIASATGYRTDDLAARLLQNARDETAENFARDPEPVPSGREIVDSELTSLEVASVNRALDNSPSKIEDYRSPVARVPRNATVPEHMQVSTVPAESRRH
jgi:hypothetical protein